ncbi:MAG: HD domain-containing protein [Clostridia bacterium]|nr:HD domain-containing protein [Clostridia bacterium]
MERAKLILKALEERGYESYIVGGAVRSLLLGLPQHDIDILTLAPPEEVERTAVDKGWKVKKIGMSFGVLVVVVEDRAYEVATARTETYGRDSHRPEYVEFTDSIVKDLSRRDFTINAMAMDLRGNILDPFGGRGDLKRGIVRAVGDPEERFKEDGLRPFRAVRFAAQLGFKIDEQTFDAIPKALHRVRGLSVERIRGELEKILLAPYASRGMDMLVETGLAGTRCLSRERGEEKQVDVLPELYHMVGLEQSRRYHTLDVWNHTLKVLDNVPSDLILRWAALLHDVAKGLPGIRGLNKRGEIGDPGHDKKGAEMAEEILTRLKVYPSVTTRVCWLVRYHMGLPNPDRKSLIKWLRKQSVNFRSQRELHTTFWQLLQLCRADVMGGMVNPDFSKLDELIKLSGEVLKNVPFYEKELAIRGREVAEALGQGPQVKKFLRDLLIRIQSGEFSNTEENLREALERKVRRLKMKQEALNTKKKA